MEDTPPVSVQIVSQNSGLTQESTIYYRIDSNGRRKICENDDGMCIKRSIRFALPLMMTPEVWMRHNFSLSDVVDVLDCFKANQLWQLAQLLGIPVSSSSVKLGFSSAASIICSSKAIIMEKITKTIRESKHYTFGEQSVLDKTHEDHVPQLPTHYISHNLYSYWKLKVNPISMLNENPIGDLFVWKGITLTPIGLEGDHLYMIRVVRKDVFINSNRPNNSLVNRPVSFKLNNLTDYCGLIDEAAFFLPASNK
jgi:hypothetical protein